MGWCGVLSEDHHPYELCPGPATDGAEQTQQQRQCHGMCHEPCSASVPTAGTGSAQFRALLDQGSSLYVCSHQGLCVGFMCSQCLLWVCFHIQDLPLFSSLCHPHCPFPPWLLCLPSCSCTPAESQGAVPEGSVFDPKQ